MSTLYLGEDVYFTTRSPCLFLLVIVPSNDPKLGLSAIKIKAEILFEQEKEKCTKSKLAELEIEGINRIIKGNYNENLRNNIRCLYRCYIPYILYDHKKSKMWQLSADKT